MSEHGAEGAIQAQPSSGDEIDAEYGDPYDGITFAPFNPTEAVSVPLGTPLGTGQDTENSSPGVFDDHYKDDFEGLMFLGALQAQFSYIGHKFNIRTLSVDELLAAAIITKRYEDTIGANRAYATAMVALCTVSVDGIGLPAPIGEGDESYAWAFERFDYVKAKWFPYTVDYVYERYLLLEDRVRNVLVEMTEQAKKAESRAGSTSG